MKNYRRILIAALAEQAIGNLLPRAAALAGNTAEVMVAQIIDTTSGFAPDGPAAVTAEEKAARKLPGIRRRLELELAHGPLAGAQAQVLVGSPAEVLAGLLREWEPDLIVAAGSLLPQTWIEQALRHAAGVRPDVLKVERPPLLAQLLDLVIPRTAGQT